MPDHPQQDLYSLALRAYVKLIRTAETVAGNTHRHLMTYNLSISQFGVLEALYHLGPLCQRDIGKKILKSSGNITTVIDNLERRQLVERVRSVKDRRYIAVHLTQQGKDLVKEVFPPHAKGIEKEFSVLTPEEMKELSRICRKLSLVRTDEPSSEG